MLKIPYMDPMGYGTAATDYSLKKRIRIHPLQDLIGRIHCVKEDLIDFRPENRTRK